MSDASNPENQNRFLGNVAYLAAIMVTVVTCTGWISNQLNSHDRRLDKMDERMMRIEAGLNTLDERMTRIELEVGYRWFIQDQILWSMQLQERNPKVDVPLPRDIINMRLGHRPQ
jgi:hypothetical protein